jgi:hypothetical protein
MQYTPEAVDPYVKAKTHYAQADELEQPHLVYLERWRGFEILYREVAPKASKHDAFVFARDAGELDFAAACLAQLSRPRVDAILRSTDIGELNVLLSRKNMAALVGQNQLLEELGVDMQVWLSARKDLRFALKANTVKGLRAIATMLLIVRAACDPKVKKTGNLVKDEAVLAPANRLLKDCLQQLVEHFQKEHDAFFKPDFRMPQGRKV